MPEKKRVTVSKRTSSSSRSQLGSVPSHRHCRICQKPTPVEEEFCSESCRLDWQKLMKKKRNQLIFIWIMAAVLIVFAVLMYY